MYRWLPSRPRCRRLRPGTATGRRRIGGTGPPSCFRGRRGRPRHQARRLWPRSGAWTSTAGRSPPTSRCGGRHLRRALEPAPPRRARSGALRHRALSGTRRGRSWRSPTSCGPSPTKVSRWMPRTSRRSAPTGSAARRRGTWLRRFFEVDAGHVVVSVLHGLAADGTVSAEVVARAIDRYGIDRGHPTPGRPEPTPGSTPAPMTMPPVGSPSPTRDRLGAGRPGRHRGPAPPPRRGRADPAAAPGPGTRWPVGTGSCGRSAASCSACRPWG